MTFLFMATIGPVQPFIASARRTRDLYAGSTLLSELSKAAAEKIAKHEGHHNLVFPAPIDEKDLSPSTSFNVANKIVAIVEQPNQVGKKVREAIQDRLSEIKEKAFATLKGSDLLHHNAADAQIKELVEYFWVAVPFGNTETYTTYEKAREKAEAILAARKNTHVFAPVTWGSNQEKSSLDGKLECVIPASLYKGQADQAKELYKRYKAGPHERLSAVDLLKRLSAEHLIKPEPETVPHMVLSTSHIAAIPFLQRLSDKYQEMSQENKDKIRAKWEQYLEKVMDLVPSQTIGAGKNRTFSAIFEQIPQRSELRNPVTEYYDGALLFEERLLDDVTNKDNATFKAAQIALKNFFTCVGMHPSPYYALLLADGDGMGKAIDACTKGDNGQTQHRALSRALSRFSKQVATIVQQHSGSLVYAGGDDVMALLPLHTVLNCAHDLSEEFRENLKGFAYEDEDHKQKYPTLSAGIAVVHHVSLLDEALALARSAEHRAKEQPEKNALAITVSKRSGEDYPLTVSWQKEPQPQQSLMLYAQFKELVALYEHGFIPKGTAYELRDMVQRLQPTKGDEQSKVLNEIMQIDAARILRRKLLLPGRSTSSKAEAETIFARLLEMIGVAKDENRAFKTKAKADVTQFINALIVAQSFAEEVEGEQKGRDIPHE